MDAIYEPGMVRLFRLQSGGVCVVIHSGSRGLGQICTDHVRSMQAAMARYGIQVLDR